MNDAPFWEGRSTLITMDEVETFDYVAAKERAKNPNVRRHSDDMQQKKDQSTGATSPSYDDVQLRAKDLYKYIVANLITEFNNFNKILSKKGEPDFAKIEGYKFEQKVVAKELNDAPFLEGRSTKIKIELLLYMYLKIKKGIKITLLTNLEIA